MNFHYKKYTPSLDESLSGNLSRVAVILIIWLLSMRAVVAVLQWQSGYMIFGGFDQVMIAVTLYAFWQCRGALAHQFGYIKAHALDDALFASGHARFWSSLWALLAVTWAIGIFLYPAAILIAALSFHFFGGQHKRQLSEEYLSGTRRVSADAVNRAFDKEVRQAGRHVWFGGACLPPREWVTHFKIIGSAGSGKTTMLRLFMRSALSPIGQGGCDDRAILFDPATEFLPALTGWGVPMSAIVITNLFDARACAWDIAHDLPAHEDADTIGHAVIRKPENGGAGAEFFSDAARRPFAGIVKFFQKSAPGQWTLRDVLLAAQSPELIGLLAGHDRALMRDMAAMGKGDTAGNVMATIAASIGGEMETVAALMDWHARQGRTFRLEEFFKASQILMLGNAPRKPTTLRPYNELVVNRFAEILKAEPHAGHTFCVFDELPVLGKVGEAVSTIAAEARKRGACVVIAFQAYSQMKKMFGEEDANTLIAQCDKSAYMRVMDADSAKWASEQIGNTRLRRWLRGFNRGTAVNPGQMGQAVNEGENENEQIVDEPAVRPDALLNLPKPDKGTGAGVKAFYRVGNYCYEHEIKSAFITAQTGEEDASTPAFVPVPKEATTLRPWEEDDLRRLGILGFFRGLDGKKLAGMPLSDMAALCMEAATLDVQAAMREAERGLD